MSSVPSSNPDAPPRASVCLVILGTSPHEKVLRRSPDIDVIRSRNSCDAIGELGYAREQHHDQRIVLLLTKEAPTEQILHDFLAAAKVVVPSLRVLVDEDMVLDAGMCDEQLPGDAHAAVRCVLATSATPVVKPEVPVEPEQPSNDADYEPHTTTSEGHEAQDVVETLLRGRSILEPALATLRIMLGDAPVRFVGASDADLLTDEPSIEVMRGKVVFGWLIGLPSHDERARDAARWLASWLALAEQHRQLQEAALTDELTGAWNRRYCTRYLGQAIDRARANRRDLSILLYDLDNFKHFNDTYGHSAGDEILSETVRLLKSCIRPTDRVCRIGGDEFAVIFDDPAGPRGGSGQHPTSLTDITERFQRQICMHKFPKLGPEAQSTLTISGGMATFPWDAHDAASLMEMADSLALESKRQGKGLITLGPGAESVCRLRFHDEMEDPSEH